MVKSSRKPGTPRRAAGGKRKAKQVGTLPAADPGPELVAPAESCASRLRGFANRLETEWLGLPPLPAIGAETTPAEYAKYKRQKDQRTRFAWRMAVSAGGVFLEAIRAGAFRGDKLLHELVSTWDSALEAKRNHGVFMAACQHWLPTKRPTFRFGQDSASLIHPCGLGYAYADAMRALAEEIDQDDTVSNLVMAGNSPPKAAGATAKGGRRPRPELTRLKKFLVEADPDSRNQGAKAVAERFNKKFGSKMSGLNGWKRIKAADVRRLRYELKNPGRKQKDNQ